MALDRHAPAGPGRRRRDGPSRVSPDPRDLPGQPRARARHGPAPRTAGSTPRTLAEAITDDTAAVVIQHPNFFGQLEDVEALVEAAHAQGGAGDRQRRPDQPRPACGGPDSYGADIVVAEGQCLGNPMAFGGPYLGIMACREEYVRKMPGRIVGQTTDRNGKRCWVLTLQTREQHIRREKATSNICTNQGLLALRAEHLPRRRRARRACDRPPSSRPARPTTPPSSWRACRASRSRSRARSSRSSSSARRRTRRSVLAEVGRAGLSRRDRPRPLVSRARRRHPRRRDREADEGRDRRAGAGVCGGHRRLTPSMTRTGLPAIVRGTPRNHLRTRS